MDLTDLSIHDVLHDIKTTLEIDLSLIIEMPPGAGRTTHVPLSLLDRNWLANARVTAQGASDC